MQPYVRAVLSNSITRLLAAFLFLLPLVSFWILETVSSIIAPVNPMSKLDELVYFKTQNHLEEIKEKMGNLECSEADIITEFLKCCLKEIKIIQVEKENIVKKAIETVTLFSLKPVLPPSIIPKNFSLKFVYLNYEIADDLFSIDNKFVVKIISETYSIYGILLYCQNPAKLDEFLLKLDASKRIESLIGVLQIHDINAAVRSLVGSILSKELMKNNGLNAFISFFFQESSQEKDSLEIMQNLGKIVCTIPKSIDKKVRKSS